MQQQVQVNQRNQDVNYILLLEETWLLVSKLKFLWFFGLFAALASTTLNRRGLIKLFPITIWNDFPYKHLSSLTLPDVPSDRWTFWLGWTNLPPVFITSFAILLWLGHLLAQAGLIKIAIEANEGQLISIKRTFLFCLSSGWRIVLLNFGLFGIAYLAICLGMLLFSPDLYPTSETEWPFVQKYQGWPHNILGALAWWLIPINILATVVYPFAKRSIILSKPTLSDSLRYSISLIRYNFLPAIKLLVALVILSYGLAGLIGLGQVFQEFTTVTSSIGYILNHPIFLAITEIITVLFEAFLAVMLSVFGTYVYLAYEKRYQSLYRPKRAPDISIQQTS